MRRARARRPLRGKCMTNDSDDSSRQLPESQVHEITLAIESLRLGDPKASDELIRLTYDELRGLARSRLAREPKGGAGMTLDATALVHEAYLRVIGNKPSQK